MIERRRFRSAPTEQDFKASDLMLAFTAGATAMGFGIIFVIVFFVRPLCN